MSRHLASSVVLLSLLSGPAAADEAKQARKVAKAAVARTAQWMRARDSRSLLKKGSGLKATRKTVRQGPVVNAFLGFVPAAWRKAQGSPGAFVRSLFRRRRPTFLGQPLLVRSYKLRAVSVHRDAVTVDVEVTWDTAKGETEGLRLVWVKEKSKLVLALRAPAKPLAHGKQQQLGPAGSGELLKTKMAKSARAGIAFLLEVEELLAERPKPKVAQEKLQKLSLADFGEFVGTSSGADGAPVGEVRCGYLLVRITPRKGDDFAGLEPGDTVLFSGDVTRVPLQPWRDRSYEREGVKYAHRCVVVDVKGGAGKRER